MPAAAAYANRVDSRDHMGSVRIESVQVRAESSTGAQTTSLIIYAAYRVATKENMKSFRKVILIAALFGATNIASAQALDFSKVTCAEFKDAIATKWNKEFGLKMWFWSVGYWSAQNGVKVIDPTLYSVVVQSTIKECDKKPSRFFLETVMSYRT